MLQLMNCCRIARVVLMATLLSYPAVPGRAEAAARDSTAESIRAAGPKTVGVRSPGLGSSEAPPAAFELLVELEGREVAVELRRRSVRTSSYESLAADGAPQPLGPVSTYQGWFVGDPSIRVAASLRGGVLRATVFPTDAAPWRLRAIDPSLPLSERSAAYRVEEIEEADPADLELPGVPATLASSPRGSGEPSEGTCGVVRAELALDCSFSCFEELGQDVVAVQELFEELVNELNAIYVRDLRIEYALGRTVIRTDPDSDPYFEVPFFDKLTLVMDEWETNQSGSEHDVAALIDGDGAGSGLAWVGAVCTNIGYSINGFDAFAVTRHELGHNWGAGHFAGGSPEGATIMSGNSIARFSGPEKDEIMPHRDSRTCLEDLGAYPIPTPPYAHFDSIVAPSCGSETIPVLLNDEDANCESLSIRSWDAATPLGGTVSLDGESLNYSAGSSAGLDSFTYTIEDEAGIEAVGNVRVEVADPARVFLAAESADSAQAGEGPELAVDGDLGTHWHTMFSPELDPLPHEIVLDQGFSRSVLGLGYWPRQDGGVNGHIGAYEIFVSDDPLDWGEPVATGELGFSTGMKKIDVPESVGRYVRVVALTEANGGPWTSAAEFEVLTAEELRPPDALFAVDSEQVGFEATLALDGEPGTYWHTEFSPGVPPLPHNLDVDLGIELEVSEVVYLPRQDGGVNGTITEYEVWTSLDGVRWSLAAVGVWPADTTEKRVAFPPVRARYGRLLALGEYGGGPWSSAAEVEFVAAGLGLEVQNLVSGEVATFVATGSRPGRVVGFAASLEGTGCGPCVPGSDTVCLGLAPPLLRLGTVPVAADGAALLERVLPSGFDGRELWIQAFELESEESSRLSAVRFAVIGE